MLIARTIENVVRQTSSVVTVGSFDGVHLGHASIIDGVLKKTMSGHGRSVVVTFDPHPREVVGRGNVEYLTTVEERLHLLALRRIDLAVVIPFTYEFSRMTPAEFYRDVIVESIGVSEVVVGHDHMFGRDREAGFRELQLIGERFGFATTEVDPVHAGGMIVSSTAIRTLLLAGNVESAAIQLGRPYGFRGTVVPGAGRGTGLGFPTANINPQSEKKLVPGGGVYVVRLTIGERVYHGMLNIGTRPTFEHGTARVIEVHVFGFEGNGYGLEIDLHFLKRLREERKFATKELLIEQLHRDRQECLEYLEHTQSS
jgi:riboflavin kinase/FMN adenylyltransferase